MLNLRSLLEAGHAALNAEHAAAEVEKAGSYRIGTSGCVTDDGNVYGTCHRVALARFVGADKTPDVGTSIMWAAGERLEDTLTKVLAASGHRGKILRHDDVLVQSEAGGRPLVGHPDIVLADEDGKPLYGIESKGVFGGSTAVAAGLERRPKNANLIQAAAYSMCLGIPYVLLYTNPSWFKPHFKEQKTYGCTNIKPFYSLFFLEWRNDVLHYRHEDRADWTQTCVTKSGILDYYALVTEMGERRELGPRVSGNYVNGEPNKWGPESECKFCPYSSACDRYDVTQSFDNWIDALSSTTAEGDE